MDPFLEPMFEGEDKEYEEQQTRVHIKWVRWGFVCLFLGMMIPAALWVSVVVMPDWASGRVDDCPLGSEALLFYFSPFRMEYSRSYSTILSVPIPFNCSIPMDNGSLTLTLDDCEDYWWWRVTVVVTLVLSLATLVFICIHATLLSVDRQKKCVVTAGLLWVGALSMSSASLGAVALRSLQSLCEDSITCSENTDASARVAADGPGFTWATLATIFQLALTLLYTCCALFVYRYYPYAPPPRPCIRGFTTFNT